jgi:putative membrane protein insertion efficiency factor
MSCNTIILTCFVLIFWTTQSSAQCLVTKNLLCEINKPQVKEKQKAQLGKTRNELEGTASLFFTTYKNYISPQDMSSCVFHPSCSSYAMQAIKQDNPFVAYVKIFDRLTRCHPLIKQEQYPFNKKTGLYNDPIL